MSLAGPRKLRSKWHEAKWATQRRIAEDGTVYTLEEFAEHYKSQWQQKLGSPKPPHPKLGRPLGYFRFSLIGFKRTLFTNIFQRLGRANQ